MLKPCSEGLINLSGVPMNLHELADCEEPRARRETVILMCHSYSFNLCLPLQGLITSDTQGHGQDGLLMSGFGEQWLIERYQKSVCRKVDIRVDCDVQEGL